LQAAHVNALNACSVPTSASHPILQQHSPGSQQQHRLSGQSYESGVSGVSGASSFSSARQSYHSNSSSSLGSLDRLEESGYASTINVHNLFQAGLGDEEVLRAWLADMHFEEYAPLFRNAGYDMPTISRMTPEVSALLYASVHLIHVTGAGSDRRRHHEARAPQAPQSGAQQAAHSRRHTRLQAGRRC
jgi:hypothetical protein